MKRGWFWFLGIFFILALLGIFWMSIVSNGSIFFVSCPPRFHWKVDHKFIQETQKTANQKGNNPSIIVYLACKLEKTQEYTGWGDLEPFAYAGRMQFLGMPVIRVSVDTEILPQYKEEQYQSITGYLVVRQIGETLGLDEEVSQEILQKAIQLQGENTPIQIKPGLF